MASLVKLMEKKMLQFDVTFATYMFTPMEKFFFCKSLSFLFFAYLSGDPFSQNLSIFLLARLILRFCARGFTPLLGQTM